MLCGQGYVLGRIKNRKAVCVVDMYPQYWTPSIGGIFMKYSYEFKLMCVDMYRQGKWPETPKGIKDKTFHDKNHIKKEGIFL